MQSLIVSKYVQTWKQSKVRWNLRFLTKILKLKLIRQNRICSLNNLVNVLSIIQQESCSINIRNVRFCIHDPCEMARNSKKLLSLLQYICNFVQKPLVVRCLNTVGWVVFLTSVSSLCHNQVEFSQFTKLLTSSLKHFLFSFSSPDFWNQKIVSKVKLEHNMNVTRKHCILAGVKITMPLQCFYDLLSKLL